MVKRMSQLIVKIHPELGCGLCATLAVKLVTENFRIGAKGACIDKKLSTWHAKPLLRLNHFRRNNIGT
jgi:hypothetical protein